MNKFKGPVVVWGIALLLLSCSLLSWEREYQIFLPDLPGDYDFIDTWEVLLLSESGEESCLTLPADRDSFTFSALHEEGFLVLAYGKGAGDFLLKPAGLYLDGSSGGGEQLTFDQGPALSLLADLLLSGFDIRTFNGSRLLEEWNWEGMTSPWHADFQGIGEAALSGDFRVTHIREAPLYQVDYSGDEGWVGDDPFGAGNIPSPLPAGDHLFYHREESRLLKISLDEEGNLLCGERSVRIP
ncbi:MAG: hypothetical protein PQJ60_06315 [Spirochaetales bacterium]|nr:hypothetical protein [Spirochaetales bacterium]